MITLEGSQYCQLSYSGIDVAMRNGTVSQQYIRARRTTNGFILYVTSKPPAKRDSHAN